MSNMSYCRFQNTRKDLDDCIDAIQNGEELSYDEARAGKWMFDDFLDLCRHLGFIDSYDSDAVYDFFDSKTEDDEVDDDFDYDYDY